MSKKKRDDDDDNDQRADRDDTSDVESFDDDDAERPWDEARWEKEFKLSDARADRFGELLETFIDHPNRDEIVAREMGWNELADDLSAAKESGELNDDDDDEPFDASEFLAECDAASAAAPSALDDDSANEDDDDTDNPFGSDDDADDDEDFESEEIDPTTRRKSLLAIPAFVLARDIGMKIHHMLQPYMEGPDDDDDGKFGEAYIGCHIAAAKISGGHAMGYDDDVLCGNIVNNRIGLAAVEKSIVAFNHLKSEKRLPAEVVDAILPELAKVCDALRTRITELRAKVWW